jgi:hypothetical protein
VHRRSLQSLVYVLVAVQLLLGGPMAQAFAQVDPPAAEAHCADMAPEGQAPCPCCPDGDMTLAGCSSGCLLVSGPAPALGLAPHRSAVAPRIEMAAQARAAPGDPPLKPPPII